MNENGLYALYRPNRRRGRREGSKVRQKHIRYAWKDGKPVEAWSQKNDNRFQIQRDTHKELVRRDGYHVFDFQGSSR